MNQPFTRIQRRVVFACTLAYVVAYCNRFNLSAALEQLGAALSITPAQAGLIQTCFAVTYAAGQLVNGMVVDRVKPVRHMVTGVCIACACNILMGTVAVYPAMLALSLINGAGQSMLWTPIVRLLARFFPEERQRRRANMIFSFAVVIGHLAAWAASGVLASAVGWRLSFLVPGALGLPCLAVICALVKDSGESSSARAAAAPASWRAAWPIFARTGLLPVFLASILYGFVRDCIVTWVPTLLSAEGGGSALSSTALSLIIPLLNAAGIALGYVLRERENQSNRRVTALMMACAGLCCVPLLLVRGALPMALLMGASCACMYGLNPILTALIPLEYERAGCIALAAGLMDGFIYVGSSLAGVTGGAIYGTLGARPMYLCWILAALAAAALFRFSGWKRFTAPLETPDGLPR